MTLRRALTILALAAVVSAVWFGVGRWRAAQQRARLAGLRSALATAEAYPRRLSGEHDAAVAERERLARAIEEVDLGVNDRDDDARRTVARRRQTERIYRILEIRRRSAPLLAELPPPRPPGEDKNK